MTINKIVLASSLLLAIGVSATGFANEKPEMVDAEAVTIECVSAADVEAMTDEDKSKLTLPVCENVKTEEETTPAQ